MLKEKVNAAVSILCRCLVSLAIKTFGTYVAGAPTSDKRDVAFIISTFFNYPVKSLNLA